MRGYHDIGGLRAGPIDRSVHRPPRWAYLVEAMRTLLGDRYCLHEQRRKIEELGEEAYARLGYFELRAAAMAETMIEKGYFTDTELAAKMASLGERKD
jgi:hypothetical protein